jgi:hypothetical protein
MAIEESDASGVKEPSRTLAKRLRGWIVAVVILILVVLGSMSVIPVTCPAPAVQSPATAESASTCLPTAQVMENHPEPACADQLTSTEEYVQKQFEAGQPAKLPFADSAALRGCFIKRLLVRDPKITRAGLEIRNATIIGPIDLRNQEIAHDVEFIHCHFLDWVNLKRSHFTKRLSFSETTFSSRFDAESAVIDVDFSLDNCTFEDCYTFLKSVHVGGDFWLPAAKFVGGQANLTSVEVKGDLNADGSQFHQGEKLCEKPSDKPCSPVVADKMAADFESMKVSGATKLSNAAFYGYAGFGDSHFANLFLDRTYFYGNTGFTRTKADGIFLDDANFLAAAPAPQSLWIADMSFQEMTPASWEKLKNFATATQYQPDFYSNLEALFRRHEYPSEAREVFIAGKQRYREEVCLEMNKSGFFQRLKLTLAWLLNFVLDKSLGYGRHLERALIASAIILFLGWSLAFRKEEWMKTKDSKDAVDFKGKYRGFWYSLDLFLPVVDFGDEEIWTPNEDRPKSAFYRRIHMILGHILVPLGLAALTLNEIIK